MKIKQIEELVGMTSKNIRFYEDQGLITPKRADNGYRDYDEDDVRTLKMIHLLRLMGISVSEIGDILKGRKSLSECLKKSVESVRLQQENLKYMELLADRMLSLNIMIDSLDPDAWLNEIGNMQQRGAKFADVTKIDIHRKKKSEAVLGTLILLMILGLCIVLLFVAKHYDPEIPTVILAAVAAILTALGVAFCITLIKRLKEIDGGEEDEAAKY